MRITYETFQKEIVYFHLDYIWMSVIGTSKLYRFQNAISFFCLNKKIFSLIVKLMRTMILSQHFLLMYSWKNVNNELPISQ